MELDDFLEAYVLDRSIIDFETIFWRGQRDFMADGWRYEKARSRWVFASTAGKTRAGKDRWAAEQAFKTIAGAKLSKARDLKRVGIVRDAAQ